MFLLGLAVGSFLNVLIFRLPLEESFIRGRSRCPDCRHNLSWKDLFPLISFLVLKRKCRYCFKKISWRYFGVELLSGLIFLAFFWVTKPVGLFLFWPFLFWLAVLSLLIVLLFIDFDYLIIPDKILLVLGLLAFLYHWLTTDGFSNIFSNFLVGTVSGLIFFLIFAITRGYYREGGMGLGDVKLVALLGFTFGWPAILLIIYLALGSGLIWSVVLLLWFGGKSDTKLPFGSLLAGSAIIFVLFNKFFMPNLWPYIVRFYL
ncbi:MAG: leader peptidase (prepilin peptidase) / N-methyltransferase [Parcubacteria group bacterium Gr01-1014_44]|nr:MAG: leader peptidase (prepilin peptidase) / N-methyltransferase [Parcubacteria group bacterium Gr01-1014_44]